MMTFTSPEKLRASLKLHEGVRALPYKDSVGHITIGVGHNLDAEGLPPSIIEALLDWDITHAVLLTDRILPWVKDLDDVRKRVFVELVFNMGSRILGFHTALGYAQAGDWLRAATEFRQSLWARQVGKRALTLTTTLQTGLDA